jgi:hypothetical protein
VRHRLALLLWISFMAPTYAAWAQESGGNDNPTLTTSLGIPLSGPLNPMKTTQALAGESVPELAVISTDATALSASSCGIGCILPTQLFNRFASHCNPRA